MLQIGHSPRASAPGARCAKMGGGVGGEKRGGGVKKKGMGEKHKTLQEKWC